MRRILLATTVLSMLAGSQLFAVAVYIPISVNETVEGRDYVTRVWVSNPTGQARQFTKHFIRSGIDGSVAERMGAPISVGSGGTFLIGGDAPLGTSGMLEINADPELVITSELVPSDSGVPGARVRVPAVSGANLIPGGQAVSLLNLESTSEGTDSNVGILNLAKDPAECSAKVFDGTGDQIGGAAVFMLPPVSHVEFDNALSLIGILDGENFRAEFSCDQSFFAYATIFGVEAAETIYIAPAVAGNGELLIPGDEPPSFNIIAAGPFHVATTSDPYQAFDFPVQQGVLLSHVEVDFDFFLGRFNSNLFHTVNSLRSGGLYYALTIRGSNSRTFWDTNQETNRDGPWTPGHTYHIHIVFDAANNTSLLEVSEFGVLLQRITAPANRTLLANVSGQLRLDFSQQRVFDNAFFPLWGSTFSNLTAKAFPLEAQ